MIFGGGGNAKERVSRFILDFQRLAYLDYRRVKWGDYGTYGMKHWLPFLNNTSPL